MSLAIPRVKPLGWGLYEILTSSQITQMDLNISLLDSAIETGRASLVANWPERPFFANPSAANSELPIAWDGDPASPQGYNGSASILMVSTADTKSVTSDDGTLWRNPQSYGGTLLSAAADLAAGRSGSSGGVRSFLASGASGTIIRTVDAGTNWTSLGGGGTIGNNSILCNGPGANWVAAGDGGVIKYSNDGLTWVAPVSVPAGWTFSARRAVWNGSLYVITASGSHSTVLTSPDGLTWTLRNMPVSGAWNGVAHSAADDCWIAVAGGGDVAISQFGTTWSARPINGYTMRDLAVVGNLWVAVANQLPGVIYSNDKGISWKRVMVGNHRTALGWNRVIAFDNRFLVVHADGTNIEFALSLRSG